MLCRHTSVPKTKSKKKAKKTKFKSLKKGGLASERQALKEESSIELMPIDDDILSSEPVTTPDSAQERKRKPAKYDEDVKGAKKSKKLKKSSEVSSLVIHSKYHGKRQVESKELKQYDVGTMVDLRPINRSKMGGKILISPMPVKRVFTIKSERPVKKGKTWSKDYFPSADSWMQQEDAVLCASVHEYGPHWSLVSDILYGMTAGGVYRGRYRHPLHCCERFRELIQRYVLSAADNVNDRSNNTGSIKGLLKVTEVSWNLSHLPCFWRRFLNLKKEEMKQRLIKD